VLRWPSSRALLRLVAAASRTVYRVTYSFAAAALVASSQPLHPCRRTRRRNCHRDRTSRRNLCRTSHRTVASLSHPCRFAVALLSHRRLTVLRTATTLCCTRPRTCPLPLCRTLLRPLFAASLPLCCLASHSTCCYLCSLALPYCAPHLCFSAAFACTLSPLRYASMLSSVCITPVRAVQTGAITILTDLSILRSDLSTVVRVLCNHYTPAANSTVAYFPASPGTVAFCPLPPLFSLSTHNF